jgi:hypothetical protein
LKIGPRESDPAALQLLLDSGARVRGVRHLHAKLYVFGQRSAVLGSVNLTSAALTRNHELGAIFSDNKTVKRCSDYFDEIWAATDQDLSPEQLAEWTSEFDAKIRSGAHSKRKSPWADYGAEVPMLDPRPVTIPADSATQWKGSFVKFFGTSEHRWQLDRNIVDELHRSGCHWACGYPLNRRPRSVRDGDVAFMGRLTENPNDTIIFGRATALRYRQGLDEASANDIRERPWRREWPHYIRVLKPEFVDGRFSDGVSLSSLMQALGADSFVTTQEHARSGEGNTDPRAALAQKPAVRLTDRAYEWLNERLELSFARCGKIDLSRCTDLHWPEHARGLSASGRSLLSLLRAAISSEQVEVENPETFLSYKQAVIGLGMRPIRGHGLARQLRTNGLDDLDGWTQRFRLPAITGLVVNHNRSHMPGVTFFRQHNVERDQLNWWRAEVRAAAAFDWDMFI